MSHMLWKPVTESDGVPYDMICSFSLELSHWKEQFLHLVGVPNGFTGEWDFVSVSQSCAPFQLPDVCEKGCFLLCK